MFVGAAIVGILTAVLVQWLHSFGRVDRGAAMGVVFTTFFAIGLIMIVRAANRVDLDPGCVLYGAVETAPLITEDVFGWIIPQSALILSGLLALNLLFVVIFYKELKITSFDPALATSLGINTNVMHYALMALVAITTVASFEIIGSILVIAMLIVPAASAHLLTERLSAMLMVAVLLAMASAGLGHVAAIGIPPMFGYEGTSTAGMMATIAGVLFLVVLLIAPRHGLVSRAKDRLVLRLRIIQEDVLGLLYRIEESAPGKSSTTARDVIRRHPAASPIVIRLALNWLRIAGRVAVTSGMFTLTDRGRMQAANLVRSHRLWESYLHDEVGLAADHVHATAHRVEHVTSPVMQQALGEATDQPQRDPHGKPVPPHENQSQS